MLRPRVMIVDHLSEPWKNVNGSSESKYELCVLEDGLEAYMEQNQQNYETLLIREDLPGVPGSELAETILNNNPDTNVVLFGCNGQNGDCDQNPSQRIDNAPSTSEEAEAFLQEIV